MLEAEVRFVLFYLRKRLTPADSLILFLPETKKENIIRTGTLLLRLTWSAYF